MYYQKLVNSPLNFWVDDEDKPLVENHKWRITKKRIITGYNNTDGIQIISIARHLLGITDPNLEPDHINRNIRDNRRVNLRIVTVQQNSWNQGKQNGNYSSEFIGVSWQKSSRKWLSYIYKNGVQYRLGLFDSEISAAKAYDRECLRTRKEFATLNFPEEETK